MVVVDPLFVIERVDGRRRNAIALDLGSENTLGMTDGQSQLFKRCSLFLDTKTSFPSFLPSIMHLVCKYEPLSSHLSQKLQIYIHQASGNM